MNGKNSKNGWVKEFEQFMAEDSAEIPEALNAKVATRMEKLLNPSAWSVFKKLLGIHVVVGFLSLLICHQFELNPFRTSISLADWFMSVGGHSVCMIGCGILFVGSSVLASGYFLTIEETRALRSTGFPQSFALAVVSLALFATAGAQLALTIAGLWMLGALIGGFIATEAVYKVKYVRIQRLQRF